MSALPSMPVAAPILDGMFATRFKLGHSVAETDESRAAGKIILDRPHLLTLARAKAPNPAMFDLPENQPYFWTAGASNNNVDFYSTRMARSSLRNYAEDANDGRAFLLGHRSYEMPIGKTVEGRFTDVGGNGRATTEVAAFTIPELDVYDSNTTSVIRGIESGIYADVSIGFSGGRWVCNLCGLDMLRSYDCCHFPGWDFEVTDPATGIIRVVKCLADVEDARLNEVSLVYDGATPNAMVLKAEALAIEGRLTEDMRRFVTTRCKRELPTKRVLVQGAPEMPLSLDTMPHPDIRSDGENEFVPPTENKDGIQDLSETDCDDVAFAPTTERSASEDDMSAKAPETEVQNPAPAAATNTVDVNALTQRLVEAESAKAILTAEQTRLNGLVANHAQEVATRDARITELEAKLTEANNRAAEMDSYRDDAVAAAIKVGVRANAITTDNEEQWTGYLKRQAISDVRMQTEAWERQALALPTSRQTSDVSNDPTKAPASGNKTTKNPGVYRA